VQLSSAPEAVYVSTEPEATRSSSVGSLVVGEVAPTACGNVVEAPPVRVHVVGPTESKNAVRVAQQGSVHLGQQAGKQ
jgi:hypothetical protein